MNAHKIILQVESANRGQDHLYGKYSMRTITQTVNWPEWTYSGQCEWTDYASLISWSCGHSQRSAWLGMKTWCHQHCRR